MLTAPNSPPATLSVPILRPKELPAKWVSFRITPPPRSSAPRSSLFSCTQRYHHHFHKVMLRVSQIANLQGVFMRVRL